MIFVTATESDLVCIMKLTLAFSAIVNQLTVVFSSKNLSLRTEYRQAMKYILIKRGTNAPKIYSDGKLKQNEEELYVYLNE